MSPGSTPSASAPTAVTIPLRQLRLAALAGRIRPARVSVSSSVGSTTTKSSSGSSETGSGAGPPSTPSRYSGRWPSPFVELEVGGRIVKVTNPDKVYFRGARRDEARPRPVLPRGRRRHRARAVRAADAAQAAPGRRRGRGDLPEARAGAAARLDRDRARDLPVRPARRRALRHRGRAGRLGGEPRRRSTSTRGRRAGATPSTRTSCASTSTRSPARRSRTAKRVAAVVREVLDEIGYVGWPKTSGNRGIHVACRIEPNWGFRVVRRCALAFAREVERRAPELVTTAWWKEERGERVFIDYNQNARDRTIALGVLGARAAGRDRLGAGHLGRAARRRDRGLHDRDDAARASRSSATCRPGSTTPSATCACCSSGSSARRRRASARRRTRRTSRRCRASRSACSRRARRRSKARLTPLDVKLAFQYGKRT